MVFMVALHFLQQLVAMDHKAMNTLTNGVLREIRMTFYIDFFSFFFCTHCNLGGWCNWEVLVLHL